MKKRLLTAFRYGKTFAFLRRLTSSRSKSIRVVRNLYRRYGLEPRPCVLCQGTELSLICEGDRYGFDLDKRICKSCGLVQTNPAPNKEFLNTFYRDHYRRLYTRRVDVDYGRFLEMQRAKALRFHEFLDGAGILSKLSEFAVVEIGCSCGGILAQFDKHCRSVQGCDLDVEAIRYGRENLDLDLEVAEFPTTLPSGPRLFILSHVLEHTHDPLDFLKKLKAMMESGDLLFLEVPGINQVAEGAYNRDLKSYFHIGHITDLSEGTLRALAARAGFDVITCNETVTALLSPNEECELPWKKSGSDSEANILRIERSRTTYRQSSSAE